MHDTHYINVNEHILGNFHLFPGCKSHFVDLQNSIRNKLELNNESHEIPKDLAIKTLKSIERTSKFTSFITKPVVVILTGTILFGAAIGLALATNAALGTLALVITLTALSIIFGGIGGGLIGFGIQNSCNEFLPKLSRAYYEQAKEARRLIDELEGKAEVEGNAPRVQWDGIALEKKRFGFVDLLNAI